MLAGLRGEDSIAELCCQEGMLVLILTMLAGLFLFIGIETRRNHLKPWRRSSDGDMYARFSRMAENVRGADSVGKHMRPTGVRRHAPAGCDQSYLSHACARYEG